MRSTHIAILLAALTLASCARTTDFGDWPDSAPQPDVASAADMDAAAVLDAGGDAGRDANQVTDAAPMLDAGGDTGRDADQPPDAASADTGTDAGLPLWCALSGSADVGIFPFVPTASLVPAHDTVSTSPIIPSGIRQNAADAGAIVRFYEDPSLYPCCDLNSSGGVLLRLASRGLGDYVLAGDGACDAGACSIATYEGALGEGIVRLEGHSGDISGNGVHGRVDLVFGQTGNMRRLLTEFDAPACVYAEHPGPDGGS